LKEAIANDGIFDWSNLDKIPRIYDGICKETK